jgi:hypothetical protein
MTMDHLAILKRMWKMLWSYRALWVFGIILALTTASGRGGSNATAQFNGNGGGQGLGGAPLRQLLAQLSASLGRAIPLFEPGDLALLSGWVAITVALCSAGLLLMIAGAVARYVAEAAVIRMVDEHEATGEKKTVGQGFRLGWSRAAWRLFLIGLVVTLPLVVGAILLFGLAALPLLAWTTGTRALGILGTVVAIGLFFLVVLALFAVAIVAQVLVRLAWRAVALEDLGVGDALRRSWALIRGHLGDVALMWLIMVGVGLGYGLLMVPVGLVILIFGVLTGGVILLLMRTVSGLFATGAVPWIVGGLLAVPVFVLIVVVPFVFLTGLYQVYVSGVWTLAFRELAALEALAAEAPLEPTPAT